MKAFYSFLPYIRTGLNNYRPATDQPGGSSATERTGFTLDIDLRATGISGGTQQSVVQKQFALKGPGDVTGINKDEIVRISPENWLTNYEPNYLPFIEFYDEDFCWRYTPAKSRKDGPAAEYRYRLRPWVTLVVLKDEEFELSTTPNGKTVLKILQGAGTLFPDQTSLWAWAHVHVNDNLAAGENPIGLNNQDIQQAVGKLRNTVLKRNPEKVVSRLISPRRLVPDTGYTAFLIPTFETGRRAGLGLEPFSGSTVQEQQGAWNNSTPAGTEFPVYHQWYFKTGLSGDFETLARLLKPRILSPEVGQRAVDLQRSNNPQLEAVIPPAPTLALRGIAQPLEAPEESWNLADANPYSQALRAIINKPTDLLEQTGSADPIIAPPIYGRWHAARDRVEAVSGDAPDWLQEANLDPRYRIYAGAGVETVRRNQEEYMNIAWQQIGEVMEANRKLLQLQVSRVANRALYNRHLTPLNNELLLNLSAPAHQRMVNLPRQLTVYNMVHNSRIPVTAISGAFRRMTRAGSTLVSGVQAVSGSVSTTQILSQLNTGAVQIAVPYQPPQGQFTYDIWQPQELTETFTLELPQNAGFQISNPGMILSEPYPGTISPQVQDLVTSIAGFHHILEQLPDYTFAQNPALSMPNVREILLTRTEPFTNALEIANNYVRRFDVSGQPLQLINTNQIMAAPRIKIPMYEELARLSPDWIMPGLGDIEMNSINALKISQKYLEAYMLGLNDEMARELLWRGYPTDQRGTCFSFFWGYTDSLSALAVTHAEEQIYNLEGYRDIEDIHKWRTTPQLITSPLKALGSNNARSAGTALLVLTIRGELLRKYPGTVIYLQQAAFESLSQPRQAVPGTELYPVFTGKIEPDIFLIGFSVDKDTIRGTGFGPEHDPGYFLVFQERSTEIRFGADETSHPASSDIDKWDDLSWGNLKDHPAEDGFIDLSKTITITGDGENPDEVIWNWNSATIAYALHQSPVKINIHAQGLIPDSGQ